MNRTENVKYTRYFDLLTQELFPTREAEEAEKEVGLTIPTVLVTAIQTLNGWAVDPAGFQVTGENVPLLWEHGHDLFGNIPIGWVDNFRLGTVKFGGQEIPALLGDKHYWSADDFQKMGMPAEIAEFPRFIYLLKRAGIFRGVSIGFAPLEIASDIPAYTLGKTRENEEIMLIKRWLLMEVSDVVTPADPLALDRFMQEVDKEMGAGLRRIFNIRMLSVSQTTPNKEQGAVPYEDTPPMPRDAGWDADAAVQRVRKWASSDGSGDPEKIDWGKYRRAFGWYDSDTPETFGAYKLPHHDIVDGQLKVNFRGCVAALAALHGARGGVAIPQADRPRVEEHIRRHIDEHFSDEEKSQDLTGEKESSIMQEATPASREVSRSSERSGLLRRLGRALGKREAQK